MTISTDVCRALVRLEKRLIEEYETAASTLSQITDESFVKQREKILSDREEEIEALSEVIKYLVEENVHDKREQPGADGDGGEANAR
jgi:hypothetical protein